MRQILATFLVFAFSLSSAIGAYDHFDLDSNTRETPTTIDPVYSANNGLFKVRLYDDEEAVDLVGSASSVQFAYAPMPVTGGYVRIDASLSLTNTCTFIGTNAFGPSGNYEWSIVRSWQRVGAVAGVSNTITYGQGSMVVKSSGAAGSSTILILRNTVNWDTIVNTGTIPWTAVNSAVTNINNDGTSGSTGTVTRSGNNYGITFPAPTSKSIYGDGIVTVLGAADANANTVRVAFVSGDTQNWTTAYSMGVSNLSTVTALGGTNVSLQSQITSNDTEISTASANATNASALSIGTIPQGRYADCTNIWYVALCGDDANSGLTELSPKLTIQAAIDAASLIEVAGGGHQKIQLGGGDWTEDNILPKGLSFHGAGRRATRLLGSMTVSNNYNGGELAHFSFKAQGTTGTKYIVQDGMTDLIDIRLADVGFIFKSFTTFTATPVIMYSANNIWDNTGLNAPQADFTSMGSPDGSFLLVTNTADLSMNYFKVIMEDFNVTNGTLNILDFRGSGNIKVGNSSMDITLTNSFAGELRGAYFDATAGELQLIHFDIDIEGVDESMGDVDAVRVEDGTVRASFGEINIDGFEDKHSYHEGSSITADIIANFSSDTTEYYNEKTDELSYVGSPVDGVLRAPLFQFGQNGQIYSKFPESPTLTGHNGTMYINFCETKNSVSGDTNTWNNITDIADGNTEYKLQDSEGLIVGITLTVTNWNEAKGDGEDKIGTGDASWVPKIANKSQFETTDNVTGIIHVSGLVVGEMNVWEIMVSAKDAGKDCTNMTYVVGTSTGSVATVDNTSVIVTLTNAATATTETLFCIPDLDGDAFINAVRLTVPAGTGLDERYLQLDGDNAMGADLDHGNHGSTNISTLQVSGGSSLAGTTVTVFNATGAVDLDSTLNVDGTSEFKDDITLSKSPLHTVNVSSNLAIYGTSPGSGVAIGPSSNPLTSPWFMVLGGNLSAVYPYAMNFGVLDGYELAFMPNVTNMQKRTSFNGTNGNWTVRADMDVTGVYKTNGVPVVYGSSGGGDPLDGIGRVATNNVSFGGYSLMFSNGPSDWAEQSFTGGGWTVLYHTNAAVTVRTNIFDFK